MKIPLIVWSMLVLNVVTTLTVTSSTPLKLSSQKPTVTSTTKAATTIATTAGTPQTQPTVTSITVTPSTGAPTTRAPQTQSTVLPTTAAPLVAQITGAPQKQPTVAPTTAAPLVAQITEASTIGAPQIQPTVASTAATPLVAQITGTPTKGSSSTQPSGASPTPPTVAQSKQQKEEPSTQPTNVPVPKNQAASTGIPVQGPHHHPIYRYSCNEDLSVTFKGVKGFIEYVSDSHQKTHCNILEIDGHNGNFKITKECLSTTDFKKERWVKVAVYDLNEGESKTTQKVPSTQLFTGHHIFKLTCLPLKEEGVDRIALAETGITDIEQLHNVYNEIGQVEMRFKEGESLDKPDLSQVYIGDRFYLYLKYMGETEEYTIVPQTCTAYQGNYRTNDGKQLKLWGQSKGGDCVSDPARNYKVMTNFKRLNRTIVHAELHGFRFTRDSNGGFDDVTISCIVKICTKITGECADKCNIGRKKRGTDIIAGNRQKRSTGRIRSQTVSQTIKVELRQFRSNDAGRNSVHVETIAIVIAGIIFNKQTVPLDLKGHYIYPI